MVSQVAALSIIGGTCGIGRADKVIVKIFHQVMTPELLSTFTWSGRGEGNERKHSFKTYQNIQKSVFMVLKLVQNSYSMEQCIRDTKLKVLKYAYLNAKSIDGLTAPIVLNGQNNIDSNDLSIENEAAQVLID